MIHTKKWFINQVKRMVYRDPDSCKCATCAEVIKKGLIIRNKQHAEYLYLIQCDFAAEGVNLNYRDKP